jgi:hypothetical protein
MPLSTTASPFREQRCLPAFSISNNVVFLFLFISNNVVSPPCLVKDGLRSTSGRLLPKGRKKGQKQSAQGIALGIQQAQPTPYRGKRISFATMLLTLSSSVTTRQCLSMLTLLSLLHRLPFQGVPSFNASTQGDALG